MQTYGVVKIYLGTVSPQNDPPNFLANVDQIFEKNVINLRNGLKTFTCVRGQSF